MSSADPANVSETLRLAAVKSGQREALEWCYREYADALLRLAYRLTGNAQDAEDVVQDVFVGLPHALRQYEETGRFKSWLRRVTARTALMHARRTQRRREAPEEISSFQLPAPATASSLDGAVVEEALALLSPALARVFVLRILEGYSHAEIATLLHISVGTSEVRLHRAIHRLRRHLRSFR